MTRAQLSRWAESQPPRIPEPPVLEVLALVMVLLVVCFVGELWVW